jgi:hypothetical protein
MELLLSDESTDTDALNAIKKKFSTETVESANSWDVSHLIIDSMTAYVVYNDSPVLGVLPYIIQQPHVTTITLRFQCGTEEKAESIAKGVKDGTYDIKVAYHFGGQFKVAMNLVSITAQQVSSALHDTKTDGGKTNAQYVRRHQANTFVAKLVANACKNIYTENNAGTSQLMKELEEQFHTQLRKGRLQTPFSIYVNFCGLICPKSFVMRE